MIIGEMAFFIDGIAADEVEPEFSMQADDAKTIAMYPLLRKPLKALFGDKLSADGTTVNNAAQNTGAVEDILSDLSKHGGHIGKNYASFIRNKMENGLKPNIDYVRYGYDLATGNSLLFNTPFYDKLNPYIFYAMNRTLITGGKVLIVLGRHGTENDLLKWTTSGMEAVSNIPDLWKIKVLSEEKLHEDNLPDIGIISRSGVHNLTVHKNNSAFLNKVSFIVIVEPSRLVTTAQIGLNLLIKCCNRETDITFCSVDRNCDGLVDSLSHILMTNITEVSATEYPHGMSSYMYWTADSEYLQHRIVPGISRYLGVGTELSMVALKNQVDTVKWYGGETFPVRDAHWIAKQYYYDLLTYAGLSTTQDVFDKRFKASQNMCDERVCNYSFISVEDELNNLFETRRSFATIAEQQGFINVISTDYMLREYMSSNTQLFTADPKAIPYIAADFARTKRNAMLSLSLLLCIGAVRADELHRQMIVLNIDTKDPISEIWNELCTIFGKAPYADGFGDPILVATADSGKTIQFTKNDTIVYKRVYSIESGKFESVYTIESEAFSHIILGDLQYASYIAEQENEDVYIGSELKGHIYQKYLPSQFFTRGGKYYEMVSAASGNRILVRRAADHIGTRLSYKQLRKYKITNLEDSSSMGALKTVNNIGIYMQYADFSVETPGYWRLSGNNNFDNGRLIHVNGVPVREYRHKQILKLDFSAFGDAFSGAIRTALTNLLNETFITLFADNQPFISAVTVGDFEAPLTYSLELPEDTENADKCIYIVEDSQLDIGLLIAVERNIHRILQIITDYLQWNDEEIAKSIRAQNEKGEEKEHESADIFAEDETAPKKQGFFAKIGSFFKKLFKKDKKDSSSDGDGENLTPCQKRKAKRAAKKAAKKAAKEAKKAERKAAAEAKKQSENAPKEQPHSEETVQPADVPAAEPIEAVDENSEHKTSDDETPEEAPVSEPEDEISPEETDTKASDADSVESEGAEEDDMSPAEEPNDNVSEVSDDEG